MDALPRALVVAAIILGGALIVRGLYPADRYSMVAAGNGAYRVDRLTGSVAYCDPAVCRMLVIVIQVPVPGGAQGAPPAARPTTGT